MFRQDSSEQRGQLLERISPALSDREFVNRLVGRELVLYRKLLQDSRLKELHLTSLKGKPSKSWIKMAIAALDAGYSPADIAHAADAGIKTWTGDESKMWAGWIGAFESLESHSDSRVREIVHEGKPYAVDRYKAALRSERNEAVYGLG